MGGTDRLLLASVCFASCHRGALVVGLVARAISRGVPSAHPRIHGLELQRDSCLFAVAGCAAVVGDVERDGSADNGTCRSRKHGSGDAWGVDPGHDQERFTLVRCRPLIARRLSSFVVAAHFSNQESIGSSRGRFLRMRDVDCHGSLEPALLD